MFKLIQDPQSLNFYAYTRNNPIVLVDPTGRMAQWGLSAFGPPGIFAAAAITVGLIALATVNASIHLQDIPTPTVFTDPPAQIENVGHTTIDGADLGSGITTITPVQSPSGPYITVPSDPMSHVYNFGVGDIHAKANYIGKVSGGSQWYVEGGTTQAKNDFWNTVGDRETTTNYNEKYGENVITATLDNGDSISLREFSSGESTTTVQVNHTDGTKDKYRYND